MHIDLVRDQATTMPSFPDPGAVRSLRVWFCRYRTFAPISALGQLQTLVVAGFPDTSLDVLGAHPGLKYLQILHLPHVSDLSPLADFQELEVLSLATLPSWDAGGKITKVASLTPIADLPKLKHLSLFGVLPSDKSLAPIECCASLLSARFSKFPKSEVARFYRAVSLSDSQNPEPVFDRG